MKVVRNKNEVFEMTASGIAEAAVETFMAREQQRFLAQNPQSVALPSEPGAPCSTAYRCTG